MQACMLSYHVDAARVLVTAHALQRSHANSGALENHTTAGKTIYTFSYDINKNANLYPFKWIVQPKMKFMLSFNHHSCVVFFHTVLKQLEGE